MGKNKQKIDYRSIRYISDHKLEQMKNSYKDWCQKHNYNIVNMNMPYPLIYKIKMVVDEYKRRLKEKEEEFVERNWNKFLKEQNNGNKQKKTNL